MGDGRLVMLVCMRGKTVKWLMKMIPVAIQFQDELATSSYDNCSRTGRVEG